MKVAGASRSGSIIRPKEDNRMGERLYNGIVLPDEWTEKSYLAPYTEYGFGYLDAIRKVFSNGGESHKDLIPEDIDLGPYEKSYRDWLEDNRSK
jgi:hypothetical protein